ncbi:MAG: hypothetical protein U0Q10_10160 [Dermatophilaceae bacterium]
MTGLRAEVDRRRTVVAVDLICPTFAGQGLAVDLTPPAALARAYGLPE